MNDTPRSGRTAVAQRPPVGFSDIEAAARNGAAKKNKTPWYKREFNIGKAVKAEDLMNFSRQAASFLRAGIPILDSLAVIAEDNGNAKFVEVLDDLRRSLRSGTGLGRAMARHPKVFPAYYVSMVSSAELTGRLDDTLELEDVARRSGGECVAKERIVQNPLVYDLAVDRHSHPRQDGRW